MNKWVRIIVIGAIWGWLFLGWLINNFLKSNWDFHFFKWRHWEFLWSEFQQGWTISDRGTVIFFIVLFSAVPLYLAGWRFFARIEWLKLLRHCVNRLIYFLTGGESVLSRSISHKIKLKKRSSKTTRPRALDTGLRPAVKESEMKVPVDEPSLPMKNQKARQAFADAFEFEDDDMPFPQSARRQAYTVPADSPFNAGYTVPSVRQGLSAAPNPAASDLPGASPASFENILLDDIKLPERMKLEENISELMARAGYQVLEKARFNETVIDYLGIGTEKIVLGIADVQPGDWLADEERFNGEDPLWFSESSHRVSPVYQLVNLAKILAQKLSAAGYAGAVVPLFIVRKGTIINAEDMFSTWKEMSVTVCRTDVGGPDELKTVTQSVEAVTPPSAETMRAVQSILQGS